jgi:putative membrane-bound dehydrogenase-like protein
MIFLHVSLTPLRAEVDARAASNSKGVDATATSAQAPDSQRAISSGADSAAPTATPQVPTPETLPVDMPLEQFLRPVPPTEPADALSTFEVAPGLRLDLVAHEPFVCDPVAAAFDEDGRLYVTELRDYPFRPKAGDPPLGRVRLLEDTDGDGTMDRSWVFADELMYPAGVAVWKGGIFVAAAPDIWYLKDSDHDHRADIRRRVYSGFGTQNVQGGVNNLVWGIDHKIYGSGSVNGGQVRRADDPQGPAMVLDHKDFRFDPISERIEAVSGSAQFGNSFDDWYERFICSQASPGFHVVLPHEHLARNPYLAVPTAIHSLTSGVTPVFRISPLESWRVIRSSRRIAIGERDADSAGASHHVADGVAGSTVYRGAALPESMHGGFFVNDAQTNLVHRRKLVPNGVTFDSVRTEEQTELLRSRDIWFRPVNCINAPDGTIYILDLYREILEAVHIPLDVVRHLDLSHGRDRGRIYRLAPADFRPPKPPCLGRATTEELVAQLENPNAWWRETAQRLLFERRDPAAVEQLRLLIRKCPRALARLHALWSLEGLAALRPDDLLTALADSTAGIRRHAVRLAEPRMAEVPEIRSRVAALADDPEIRVRFQVALACGAIHDDTSVKSLAGIARRDAADAWMRTAILSSSAEIAAELLAELLSAAKDGSAGPSVQLVRPLAEIIGARRRDDETSRWIDTLIGCPAHDRLVRESLLGLGAGLGRRGMALCGEALGLSPAAATWLAARQADAMAALLREDAELAERQQAVELIGYMAPDDASRLLAQLIDSRQPTELQYAAVRALGRFSNHDVGRLLIERWRHATPAVRQEIAEVVMGRAAWLESLLDAVESGNVQPADIGANRRAQLISHRDASIRRRAEALLDRFGSSPRAEVVARYQPALELPASADRGSRIHAEHCAACHRLGDKGHAVGPNLALTRSRSPAELLAQVLDPNRDVDPSYLDYTVVDTQGRVHTGRIVAETAASLTLQRAEGAGESLLRTDIEEMVNTDRSLMPEGFEEKLGLQDMADLIAFLRSIQYDVGTSAEMRVEPDHKEPTSPETSQSRGNDDAAPSLPRGATVRSAAYAVGTRSEERPVPTAAGNEVNPVDEARVFTPAGFDRPGQPALADGPDRTTLEITVLDSATRRPTPCRINVVGPDGSFYQPETNSLSMFSLTGIWPTGGLSGNPDKRPTTGYGNRLGKPPVRYFGRFFYTTGVCRVGVPPGTVRIEVWKGFEHRPVTTTLLVPPRAERKVELQLQRTVSMDKEGYYSGDSHLHFHRSDAADDAAIFDLLEAEDVRYGGILCYNFDTSAYSGSMNELEYPQRSGLGLVSASRRGDYHILSGQEYRSGLYGHMNVYLADRLVLENQSLDPNHWPVFGAIGRQVQRQGGIALHAHGGYGLEIYADFVTGAVQAVELLQFGMYRGIGLDGWYHILNAGFRYPAHGASDYPPCRKLCDSRTYVHSDAPPTFPEWLTGLTEGHSFFTSGPLVVLSVDGRKPGGTIRCSGAGPHRLVAQVRVRSEVAPVTHVALVVNGECLREVVLPDAAAEGSWIELEVPLEISRSSWIAARAWSKAPSGSPDAEAHTNPVYVYLDDRTPYSETSLDWLLAKLDEQINIHRNRSFAEKEKCLDYFLEARSRLEELRQAGGRTVDGRP